MSSELGSSFNNVIAAQDVALYGGLCALASFDRPDLRRHIVDNISFRELLELNPEVRLRASQGCSCLHCSQLHLEATIVLTLYDSCSSCWQQQP